MRIPKYRHHKASGRAVVEIAGKEIPLGPYDSPESHAKYRQVIASYVATGGPPPEAGGRDLLTMRAAVGRFRLAGLTHLDPRDRGHFGPILDSLIDQFGDTPLTEFGPLRYASLRVTFVERGWSRKYVNKQCSRVKWFLRWCVSAELYPGSKLVEVREVPDLVAGRTEAPEREGVTAVPVAHVLATLPHLSRPARGLVLLQLHSGCRPGEAIAARRGEINTDGRAVLPNGTIKVLEGVWVFQPGRHKNQWRGKPRYILIGTPGQSDLAEFLEGKADDDYLFPPDEVAKTPRPGEAYLASSYGRAIARAAKLAGVPHWHPYQLRHLVGSTIRDRHGEEHAKEALGHAHLSMTAHYTGVGLEKAAEAVRKLDLKSQGTERPGS